VAACKRWRKRGTAWTGGNVQRQEVARSGTTWAGRQLPEARFSSLECKRSAAFFEEQRATGSDAVEMEGLLVQEKLLCRQLPAGSVAIVVTMEVAIVPSCTSA
jgi:hypothetical protein